MSTFLSSLTWTFGSSKEPEPEIGEGTYLARSTKG